MIQRYEPESIHHVMEVDDSGDYVDYHDHLAAMERLREEIAGMVEDWLMKFNTGHPGTSTGELLHQIRNYKEKRIEGKETSEQ